MKTSKEWLDALEPHVDPYNGCFEFYPSAQKVIEQIQSEAWNDAIDCLNKCLTDFEGKYPEYRVMGISDFLKSIAEANEVLKKPTEGGKDEQP